MIWFITSIIKKVRDAFRGIVFVMREELSFQLELLLGVGLIIFIYFMWPLTFFEIFALAITYGLILIIEMVNTSLETALERLHPERHELIGIAKDIAAGAVVLSVGLFGLVIVGVLITEL